MDTKQQMRPELRVTSIRLMTSFFSCCCWFVQFFFAVCQLRQSRFFFNVSACFLLDTFFFLHEISQSLHRCFSFNGCDTVFTWCTAVFFKKKTISISFVHSISNASAVWFMQIYTRRCSSQISISIFAQLLSLRNIANAVIY